jgi:hypothetical protein
MGGIGKTVTATTLALDDDVRSVFTGGVIWLRRGRSARALDKQAELILKLAGTYFASPNVNQGSAYLNVLTNQITHPVEIQSTVRASRSLGHAYVGGVS